MIIGYAKAAIAFLETAGTSLKWLIVAGIAIALVTIYGIWHHQIYQSGVNDTIAGIAREDKGWVDRAWEARSKLQACKALGRGWDQTTGRCQ
ncbi:hypothetical protein [Bradyrhizobium sp. USDA 4545]|uniref:hypothetical protein n=1 Tax=Bradyrhizobium sp. USDA 4545 TaxID=2817705 RepID=UPI0020A3F2A0|nr:hypothetical protein [Bradyrhizobium sp. USDA 4545]MCP1832849.1 fatty acid desaturase [Bradyrhizobium sp. USDA 4545]